MPKIKFNQELLLIIFLLAVSGIAHAFNMFNFPYYENDEGVYMSQAWSLIRHGQLSHYTYWYDHAPGGWVLIALWTSLTGGFFTFGASINSGRVLMLILHLALTYLVYYTAKRISKRKLPGTIAVLLFSLSPLAIYFQRRVLLDNIMVFWVFLSLAFLIKKNLRLRDSILSALFFGIAVLTKENAVFFMPGFLYLVYANSHDLLKRFSLLLWSVLSLSVISLYFLYALLKKEFFPAGTFGGSAEHVSLIESFRMQLSRGRGYPFWHPESDFFINFQSWMNMDPYIVILGATFTLITVLLCVRIEKLRMPAFLSVLFWFFLIRGSTVIDFYIIPLLPLLTLNVGLVIGILINDNIKKRGLRHALSALAVILLVTPFMFLRHDHFVRNETEPQLAAIEWIKTNISSNNYIVIDNYAFIDLREERFPGDRVFNHADWFWKIQADPEIRDQKYFNDWRNIDYIALSHEMLKQTRVEGTQNMLDNAFRYSYLVADWREGSTSFFNMEKYISTNGDWMSIYKVKDESRVIVENSWLPYKNNFLKTYGRIDNDENTATSEGQSYAMLRAVWLDDQIAFDGVWQWTKDHLQHRRDDKLLSWKWNIDEHRVEDPNSASDADQDIALALLFAHKRWGGEKYKEEAMEIIKDIWRKEVVLLNRQYVLTSGTDSERSAGFLVNPSYFFPAAYRIFAEVDTVNNWSKLADDSYALLKRMGQLNPSTYLVPNWILLDGNGNIRPPGLFVANENSFDHGFDSFRVYWRVALDVLWHDNQEAKVYLNRAHTFFNNELKENDEIRAVYSLDGSAISNYSTISTNAGPLSIFYITDRSLARIYHDTHIANRYNFQDGYWGERDNYYDQNWGWFATALIGNELPNLWE
jgi:endo-1,4-beta-D-glucanase Y